MRWNIRYYTGQVLVNQHSYYSDPAASFDGINTKTDIRVDTSNSYSSYNNADIVEH